MLSNGRLVCDVCHSPNVTVVSLDEQEVRLRCRECGKRFPEDKLLYKKLRFLDEDLRW